MQKLLTLVVFLPAVAFGWGFDGHRRLASMMQDPLPTNHCLKAWLQSKQTSTLQNHACDPDRWRDPANANYDAGEAPRHFLEVDWIAPITSYPRDWAQVVATFPIYYERNGRVPWRVEELYTALVAAFRARDVNRVLDVTFVLSHYVTDSFSVLHDTRYFNPGGTLHNRWESDMLGVGSQLTEITNLSRTYIGTPGRADPKNNIFDIVLVGNGLAPQLTTWNTMYPVASPDTAFFTAAKDFTARRWGDALTVLSSLVWTAWAEAGSPTLTGFGTTCSMAVPTAEIVLKGFPVSGGFTHPDGGSGEQPDASVIVDDGGFSDAGCLDGCGPDDAGVDDGGGTGGGSGAAGGGEATGGGTSGTGGGTAGSGGGDEQPRPCGCTTTPAALALGLLLGLLRKRRAR
ncbi:MAG: hypothetical protein IPJ65_19935 [Archangiaceae bacterium]|nr:hypothetical protein [Archangiaceae bacterium]